MTNAPKVAKPRVLADMSAEDRAAVVEEVKFAEFSASLENQMMQTVRKIKECASTMASKLASMDTNADLLRSELRALTRVQELALLHSLGYDISEVLEVSVLAAKYKSLLHVSYSSTRVPVSTEPGCLHEECVLEHPHAGPAELKKL